MIVVESISDREGTAANSAAVKWPAVAGMDCADVFSVKSRCALQKGADFCQTTRVVVYLGGHR